MTTTTHITSVRPGREDKDAWIVTDTQGITYHTRNQWKASLAQRAMETDAEVVITHFAGWYYRDLEKIVLT